MSFAASERASSTSQPTIRVKISYNNRNHRSRDHPLLLSVGAGHRLAPISGTPQAFLALADPVRRRIIARLSRAPATVNQLAEPFEITKQAISQHIQVLEKAGLGTRTRDAQRRPVHLNPARLEELTAWIDEYRLAHERRFRSLDSVLEEMSSAAKDTPAGTGSGGNAITTEEQHE